jgi:hypothetical protein
MTEIFLFLVVVFLSLKWWRQRDWYVVEYRSCSDEALCPIAFDAGWGGIDKRTALANDLTIADMSVDDIASFLKFRDKQEQLLINMP